MSDTYDNYSFIVDNCLRAFTRADSEETAFRRMRESWPRSTLELIGINLPSAERSMVDSPKSAPKPESNTHTRVHRAKDRTETMGDYADAINAAIDG